MMFVIKVIFNIYISISKIINNRGVTRLSRIITSIVPDIDFQIPVGKGKMVINSKDIYWLPAISPLYIYEPEIKHILGLVDNQGDFFFIDGGANIGYWSIYASKNCKNCKGIIAIEALPKTFHKLKINAELNDNSFVIFNNAIYNKSGLDVFVEEDEENHAGAHIGKNGVNIETVTIDQIIIKNKLQNIFTLIKLDVEGVEIEAIEGFELSKSLDNFVVMYEDHGADQTSKVTSYLLQKGGVIFYIDEKMKLIDIDNIQQLHTIKKHSGKGYNFFWASNEKTKRQLFQNEQ
jgi:FkbM family methyltransferase